MNTLPTIFTYEQHNIRTITRDSEPWFIARDVCVILKLTNVRQNLTKLDEDEKGVCTVYTPGGNQSMQVVSESGLYSLIFTSRKPEAKAFKRWVTHEVLPTIRKTGKYAPQQDTTNFPDLGEIIADSERLSKFIHHLQGIRDTLYPGTRKLITRKL